MGLFMKIQNPPFSRLVQKCCVRKRETDLSMVLSVLPDNVYVPDYVALDKYVKLEGATEEAYMVPTDSVF